MIRIHYWGNIIEGIFWIAIAGIACVQTGTKTGKEPRRIARRAAIAFFAFGISDFIEARTGAWYRPIWLLLLKAACVVTLVHCWIAYSALSKNKPEIEGRSHSGVEGGGQS